MEQKANFTTREIVAKKLLEQLETSSKEEKTHILTELLEHVDSNLVVALSIAYKIVKNKE
jgi:hypothetical protein